MLDTTADVLAFYDTLGNFQIHGGAPPLVTLEYRALDDGAEEHRGLVNLSANPDIPADEYIAAATRTNWTQDEAVLRQEMRSAIKVAREREGAAQ